MDGVVFMELNNVRPEKLKSKRITSTASRYERDLHQSVPREELMVFFICFLLRLDWAFAGKLRVTAQWTQLQEGRCLSLTRGLRSALPLHQFGTVASLEAFGDICGQSCRFEPLLLEKVKCSQISIRQDLLNAEVVAVFLQCLHRVGAKTASLHICFDAK